jgi:hypothetical protein
MSARTTYLLNFVRDMERFNVHLSGTRTGACGPWPLTCGRRDFISMHYCKRWMKLHHLIRREANH